MVAHSGFVRSSYCHSSSNKEKSCWRRLSTEGAVDPLLWADDDCRNVGVKTQTRIRHPSVGRTHKVMTSSSPLQRASLYLLPQFITPEAQDPKVLSRLVIHLPVNRITIVNHFIERHHRERLLRVGFNPGRWLARVGNDVRHFLLVARFWLIVTIRHLFGDRVKTTSQ